MEKADPNLTFEEAVGRLEQIVAALESGALPLDECLRQFEQAVALSRHCSAQLEAAEKQISVLSGDGGLRPAASGVWLSDEAQDSGGDRD